MYVPGLIALWRKYVSSETPSDQMDPAVLRECMRRELRVARALGIQPVATEIRGELSRLGKTIKAAQAARGEV